MNQPDYLTLYLFASSLDDVEKLRVAQENRIRQVTRAPDVPDADGICRGFGLLETDPVVTTLQVSVSLLEEAEKLLVKDLSDAMKRHPLGPWVMSQRGVGLKTAARLLAATGDPYWHRAENRPRTVGELWAYCGYRPGQRRVKGQQSNWSADARKRSWLMVQAIIKAGGPWKELWDERREYERLMSEKRDDGMCDAYQKARTDRWVAKRLLREMWRESARLHGAEVAL